MERTLVIVKPDAVQRGLIGDIIGRLERRGLRIVGLKMLQVSEELAREHYAVHEGKPFFPGLIQFITSGPVVVMALEGNGAIAVTRTTMGTTAPGQAEPGSICRAFFPSPKYAIRVPWCPQASVMTLSTRCPPYRLR